MDSSKVTEDDFYIGAKLETCWGNYGQEWDKIVIRTEEHLEYWLGIFRGDAYPEEFRKIE